MPCTRPGDRRSALNCSRIVIPKWLASEAACLRQRKVCRPGRCAFWGAS